MKITLAGNVHVRANDAVGSSAVALPRYRWIEWFALAFLFGLHARISRVLDTVELRYELTSLAPVVAAWLTLRFGPAALPLVLLYGLLPSFGFQSGPLDFFWAPPPPPALLVGAAAGAWWSAAREPAQWAGLWRGDRAALAVAGCALLILLNFESPRFRTANGPFFISVAPVAGLALLAGLAFVRWKAWSVLCARSQPRWMGWALLALPVAAVVVHTSTVSVYVAGLRLGWGYSNSLSLAVAILCVGMLYQVPRSRIWLAALSAVALLVGLRMALDFSPAASYLFDYGTDKRWMPGAAQAWHLVCNLIGGALTALALRKVGPLAFSADVQHTGSALGRQLGMQVGAAAVALLVLPALAGDYGTVFIGQDTRGWLVGALSFILALRYGRVALVWTPLTFCALAGAAMLPRLADMGWAMAGAHLVLLGALCAAWGFIGWLVHRTRKRVAASANVLSAPPAHGPRVLPVDGLARLVHRLDVSATLSSFGVLLTLVLAAFAIVEFGIAGVLWQALSGSVDEMVDRDGWLVAAGAALGGLMLALLPLSFLVVDAANRSDRMQPITGLTGAVFTAGLGIVWISVVGGLTAVNLQWLHQLALPPTVITGLALAWAFTLLAAFLLLPSQRREPVGIASLALLVPVGVWALVHLWREESANAGGKMPVELALQLAAIVGAVIVVVASLLRAVWLRVDLALPLPRYWLFGEIPGQRFWPRVAALMGMPASMWNRAALVQLAFWLMASARPLVYLGAGMLITSRWWLGAALVAAGHVSLLAGKRLAARRIWNPRHPETSPQPILFLRGFEDDQFDFRLRGPNLVKRWLALWAFRRNLDEVLVDEAAAYGTVVALGRPGAEDAPFGALRYQASHEEWQAVVLETAKKARAIVIAAGHTPGVLWEYEMLRREGLLERTLLLFHPGADAAPANLAALQVFPVPEKDRADIASSEPSNWLALIHRDNRWLLLTSADITPAHYVLALRTHLQRASIEAMSQAVPMLPTPRWPALI